MRLKTIISLPLVVLIKFYQYIISPLKPPTCRHIPTCSQFAQEALEMHGPLLGSLLSLNRIGRCHPWGTAGWDPVPRIVVKKLRLGKFPKCNLLKNRD